MLPALAVQVIWTLGLGMFAATVNVFFRDVGQLVNVGLLFWFWLTPIVYPATVLPAWAQDWAWLNLFAVFVHHYQQVFVYAQLPGRTAWLALGAWQWPVRCCRWRLARTSCAPRKWQTSCEHRPFCPGRCGWCWCWCW